MARLPKSIKIVGRLIEMTNMIYLPMFQIIFLYLVHDGRNLDYRVAGSKKSLLINRLS